MNSAPGSISTVGAEWSAGDTMAGNHGVQFGPKVDTAGLEGERPDVRSGGDEQVFDDVGQFGTLRGDEFDDLASIGCLRRYSSCR